MVNKNLLMRILSSLILAPLVISIIYFKNIIFDFMIVSLACIMIMEWYELAVQNNQKNVLRWKIIGVFYVAIPCTALLWLIKLANGHMIVLWVVLVVWATDIGAYFCGKIIGGKKLAPKISPKKTWSGLAGGIISAGLVGYFMRDYIAASHGYAFIFLNLLLALYAQLGDLLESWIKRKFDVKDSGSLIPGHGGILDRVDGFTIVAPKVALIFLLDKWHLF